MNHDNERKAFEDWAKKETCWDLYWSENIDQYMDHQTNGAWLSWLTSANREGYKLVPLEPTKEMLNLGYRVKHEKIIDLGGVYKAMIGACDDH